MSQRKPAPSVLTGHDQQLDSLMSEIRDATDRLSSLVNQKVSSSGHQGVQPLLGPLTFLVEAFRYTLGGFATTGDRGLPKHGEMEPGMDICASTMNLRRPLLAGATPQMHNLDVVADRRNLPAIVEGAHQSQACSSSEPRRANTFSVDDDAIVSAMTTVRTSTSASNPDGSSDGNPIQDPIEDGQYGGSVSVGGGKNSKDGAIELDEAPSKTRVGDRRARGSAGQRRRKLPAAKRVSLNAQALIGAVGSVVADAARDVADDIAMRVHGGPQHPISRRKSFLAAQQAAAVDHAGDDTTANIPSSVSIGRGTGSRASRNKTRLSMLIARDTNYQADPCETSAYQRNAVLPEGAKSVNTRRNGLLRGRKCAVRFIVTPDSYFIGCWNTLVHLVSLFYCIATPFHLAFSTKDDLVTNWTTTIEPYLAVLLWLDIVLRFMTAVRWRGLLVRNHGYIARTYLASWFVFDVVAALPLGYALNKMVRIMHFISLLRVGDSQARVYHRINPGLVALLKLFLSLAMVWHLVACAFWAVATNDAAGCLDAVDASEACWTPRLQKLLPAAVSAGDEASVGDRFSYAFYFAVTVTTGVGWDIIPQTQVQVLFTCFMVLLGLALFALLVGSAANAIQAFTAEQNAGRERLQTLNTYLRKHRVSFSVSERVISYLRYSWDALTEMENQDILETLPSALKSELAFEVKAQYLTMVPIFEGLPRQVLQALLPSVHRRVFLPSEVIIQEGDDGDTLYVLQRGSVAIERQGVHLSVLTDGSYFGEQALLSGTQRSASAIAISFCETVYLTRAEVQEVAVKYSPLRKALLSAKRQNLHQKNSSKMSRKKSIVQVAPTTGDLQRAWSRQKTNKEQGTPEGQRVLQPGATSL